MSDKHSVTEGMDPGRAIQTYWRFRLEKCRKALEANGFQVFVADDCIQAHEIVVRQILPAVQPTTASWGGSITLETSGLIETLRASLDIELVGVDREGKTLEQKLEDTRHALLVDLYLSSTNALTEDGKLVNLDMWGNRVGAIAFGPRKVVVLAGRNKLVANIEAAMFRIKDFAAPVNAIRHAIAHKERKIICSETGYCSDCSTPYRICNTWIITEKSFPKNRIAVILVNDDLGY
jgi:hypothetical protein